MSKLSQQDLNKLKTLVKKLVITSPVEKALIEDAHSGIELSGVTGEFQQKLYRQAQALSHIEQALSLLDKNKHTKKISVTEVGTINNLKFAKTIFGGNTPRFLETGKYYSLTLQGVPKDKKIAILKAVRLLTGLGLREAKEIVESTPYPLFAYISSEKTVEIVTRLERAGATVEIAVFPPKK